jgi:splicing factor 3A subunit 3
MDTVIEAQRKLLEERERVEEALVKEKMLKKPNVKDQINSEHRQVRLVERSVDCAKRLVELYHDNDGLRQEEIGIMGGPDEFAEFYRRLKHLKDHHRKYGGEGQTEVPMIMEFMRLDTERKNPPHELQNLVHFTDEESYGKFLDLHQLHDLFCNLKGVERVDYLTYLQSFDRLFDIPKERKTLEYRRYLDKLQEYLSGYIGKIQPLLDQSKIVSEVKRDAEEKWSAGTFPGWRKDTGSAMAKHSGAHLDLSAFSSPEELMSLGLDRLKSGLIALGLKCGGTLEERARRLFSTKGVPLESLDPALFARSKNPQGKFQEKQKEIALIEAQVYRFAEMLGEQRATTREDVERRMARTADELLEDQEEEEEEEEVESEPDDDEVPYNPKNLPLGWDGKPIPYWLYKLHGLNITYTCEICGNATYRGPKAFQRHFSEWRHAHGMRCLGIPNTAHFANVTNIEDARALWEKLKIGKVEDAWATENEEEYEDSLGNVVNKKTYEDLRRQGLL